MRTWICTARQIKALADRMGLAETLAGLGVTIVCDTCPVLCPNLNDGSIHGVVTNSGKMAHYIRGLWKTQSRLAQLEDCAKASVEGRLE